MGNDVCLNELFCRMNGLDLTFHMRIELRLLSAGDLFIWHDESDIERTIF